MVEKTLHRYLKIKQHAPRCKSGVYSGAPEGYVPFYSNISIYILLIIDLLEFNVTFYTISVYRGGLIYGWGNQSTHEKLIKRLS